MSFREMVLEEWRMHSRIYRGRNFALFPLLVGIFAAGFAYMVEASSTLSASQLLPSLPVLGLFLGLGVGMAGFSSRGRSEGLMSEYTLMIHSSRTLPVSRRRVLGIFVAKEVLYYTAFFLAPVAVGVGLFAGFSSFMLLMPAGFLAGLVAAFLLSRSSLRAPELVSPSYANIGQPVVERSEMEVERSPGGLFKLLFSFAILTGFYWFVATGFSFSRLFLRNPMVSFAAVIGTMSITVYNWLNRFDGFSDYSHLPMDREKVLEAKQKAFVRLALPFVLLLSTAPYLFYPGNVLLAGVTAVSASTYCLGAASLVLGLKPNVRIYDSTTYLKLMALIAAGTVPMLVGSVAGFSTLQMLVLNGLSVSAGIALTYLARRKSK